MEPQQQTDAKDCFPVKLAPENPSLSVIIRKKKNHLELAQYLHAACLSPVKSTMITAIKKNHFKSWPGLTPQLVSKHLPTPTATVQGHIKQEQQNLQSTKPPSPTPNLAAIRKHFNALKDKK